ncbi:ArsR/SmtB family transcription factor [Nocardiopsis sp. M1B1]|uniref:ArsR/SmtB family transcription factor n=1 Tax=Nocardiopsis sp. M1B1 TaxID=3450454 RepID=UPI00403A194C
MSSDSCELLCLDLPQAEAVRARVPADGDVRSAADRARALADPTRLRVARALAVGDELCVCDLAWVCFASQNLVSHHVRQLRTAGLASSRREGKLVMYRLTDAGHALLALLLPDPEPAVREG